MSSSRREKYDSGVVDYRLSDLTSSISTFPMKLYGLLESITDPTVACWCDHGHGFLIVDNDRFVEHLPQFFKHKKLSSFQRQLNLYGFRRDKSSSAYSHSKFQKGRRDLIVDIRRVTNSTGKSSSTALSQGYAYNNRDNGLSSGRRGKGHGATRSSARLAIDPESLEGAVAMGMDVDDDAPVAFDEFTGYSDLTLPQGAEADAIDGRSGEEFIPENTWMNVRNQGQSLITKGVVLKTIRTDDENEEETDALFQSRVKTLQSMGALNDHMAAGGALALDGQPCDSDVDVNTGSSVKPENGSTSRKRASSRNASKKDGLVVAKKSKITQNLGFYNILADTMIAEGADDDELISRTVTPAASCNDLVSLAENDKASTQKKGTRMKEESGFHHHDDYDDELLNLCESTCQAMEDAAASEESSSCGSIPIVSSGDHSSTGGSESEE